MNRAFWIWNISRRKSRAPEDAITQPPQPKDRLAKLEEKITDLEKTLADLTIVLMDLKEILK